MLDRLEACSRVKPDSGKDLRRDINLAVAHASRPQVHRHIARRFQVVLRGAKEAADLCIEFQKGLRRGHCGATFLKDGGVGERMGAPSSEPFDRVQRQATLKVEVAVSQELRIASCDL
jgi:hypothetical protein